MYPKVKVREQGDEADDQYVFEKSSLESLKAFEWLSLNHSFSSSETPKSVVRIPQSYVPKSPPPSFYASKGISKKETVVEEQKSVRATSAPRPRAVLSSPVNDGKIGSKTHTRRELVSVGLKNQNSCQNKHTTQCKIFPRSAVVSFAPSQESTHPHNVILRAKGRTTVADSSLTAAGHNRKRINLRAR